MVILPLAALEVKVTVTLFEFAPVIIVAPVGKLQLYDVAFNIGITEYATVCPWQTGVVPVMLPAAAGKAPTVIAKFGETIPLPQVFVP
jgi:hypothetical protein